MPTKILPYCLLKENRLAFHCFLYLFTLLIYIVIYDYHRKLLSLTNLRNHPLHFEYCLSSLFYLYFNIFSQVVVIFQKVIVIVVDDFILIILEFLIIQLVVIKFIIKTYQKLRSIFYICFRPIKIEYTLPMFCSSHMDQHSSDPSSPFSQRVPLRQSRPSVPPSPSQKNKLNDDPCVQNVFLAD